MAITIASDRPDPIFIALEISALGARSRQYAPFSSGDDQLSSEKLSKIKDRDMSNSGVIKEIEREVSQLKHDFEAHHWLLAVAVAATFAIAAVFWKAESLTEATLLLSKKVNATNGQLQQQLATVQQELADLRQSVGNQQARPQSSENSEPTKIDTQAAPTNHQAAPAPKRHR
jgi:hypothetical protein